VVRAAGREPPLTEFVAGFGAELMPLQN
jgi:hypothetical protein